MSRRYGKLWFDRGLWKLKCEPHVATMARRLFPKIPTGTSILEMRESEEVATDLLWFMQRYPLELRTDDRERLEGIVVLHRRQMERAEEVLSGTYEARDFPMAIPPRGYQRAAAETWLAVQGMILGDDLGLGKTVSAICALTDARTLPALVVVPPALKRQWQSEVEKFAPQLRTHIIKQSTPYPLPKDSRGRIPDILIASYHILSGWAGHLSKVISSVVFDEVHELRRTESAKYAAAKTLADAATYRLGCSATTIANYGGEIYNIVECLRPGVFGSRPEFLREWCGSANADKPILTDPTSMGSFLRDKKIFIRRTKKDVGRELPGIVRIHHEIDSNKAALNEIKGRAGELARIILSEQEGRYGKQEVMYAQGQLMSVLRQATGIAKAPYVAAFVEMLIESGESVLLMGWHRAVYEIWQEKLRKYDPAMFTGSESNSRKEAEKKRFVNRETPCLMMSLRSGQGVDGLQGVCKTIVFGELDWTSAYHLQNEGRVNRDGQTGLVSAYYLVSNGGIDPIMAEVLGIKENQLLGIQGDDVIPTRRVDTGEMIRRAAEMYVQRSGKVVA